MISISPCTAAQDWTAHLSNPLSLGGCRRDFGVGVRRVILCLDEVDVENACVFVVGVMYSIYSDDVHELLEMPADEEIDAVFRVAPLMRSGGCGRLDRNLLRRSCLRRKSRAVSCRYQSCQIGDIQC